jgi:PAS domain S-box-containing protein
MATAKDTPTIDQLNEEIAALRKENDEFRRLVSFPQTTPVPVFECEPGGGVIYCNEAAQQLLHRLELPAEGSFLPADLAEIHAQMASTGESNGKRGQILREVAVNDRVYQLTIIYSSEYDTLRIFVNDVTKHRQIEEELKAKTLELTQTQNFIEAVTKGNEVLIVMIDLNYCFTYFNQPFREEVKRLSGSEIELGMSMLDAFTNLPEQQKVIAEELSQVLRGESTNKVLEFGDPGRYRKIYNVLHIPIWDQDRNVVGAGEVAYNISEQVHAQEALLESEARYHQLFDRMTEGFAFHELIFDENEQAVDYRFLDINPAFERLTGLKRENVVGRTCREVLPGEGDKWIKIYAQVVFTGEPAQFEEYSASLDKYYEIFAYRSGNDHFATIFLDITNRKLMEDELRINLTKYAILFDTLPVGLTITDKNGKILESNQEATNLLKLSAVEQQKRMIGGKEWKVIRTDRSPMPAEEFASVKAFNENRRVENVEMGILQDADQITWISVTAAPIPLPDYGVVVAYNDISKRIEAEEALRQAHDKLEQTVEQRTKQLLDANEGLRIEIVARERIEAELLKQTRAVEAERQRFNDVLEILPVYTILLTPDYHVSFANRFFRERFGNDEGRRCYEYLVNRPEPCEQCETFKVLQTGASHHWEWVGPDNSIYDVFDFPFKDASGADFILELGIDITKRKQAEDELSALSKYNRSLFEASLDALVTITAEGKIGDVNTVTESITGYPRETLIGTDFHNYFTDPDKARQGYKRVFETGTVRDYELEVQHRDGYTTPVTYNASVYHDETGNVAGVFASARDITDRKRAENQVFLLTTALDAAANGITLVSKEGNILWSNPAISQMTGYSQEEINGQNPRLFKSGLQNTEFYRNMWDTILAGKVWHGEIVNRRKDGSLYHEEQMITPVFDHTGVITNFISIRQDITEHKQAEESLRRREEEFRSLVIATAQIVWQTNASGQVVADIPTWREYTGQTLDELMGHGWINALHPDDRERVDRVWTQAVARSSLYETEYRIRNAFGEYGDFSVRGVPIKDKDGNVSSWVGTCTDITDKKNVEKQLIQFEKHAVIGRMVGSVTHEINNPLQTIKNCLYLLQQDIKPDSPDHEPLEMALSETQRLTNIVGQLRQLYLPQNLQNMRVQDIAQIITEVHGLLIPNLHNSRINWQLSTSQEHYFVNCIKDQIIEVFLNMSLNAIEAMQSTGGTLSLNVVLSSDCASAGVIISDTGPGISSEILPHIFEPFITTKEYGLGLGLSICYGIIQKHGGQVTVESQPGNGTSFTIWLPLLEE